MNDDAADDLAALRAELGGTTTGPRPEDYGLAFRPVESFLDAPAAPARFPVRRWLPPALVAAAAVVLTVALLVPDAGTPREPEATAPTTGAPPVTGTTGTTSDLTNVAMVLREAADVSGRQPDLTDARFWRVESLQQQSGYELERRIVFQGHRAPGLLIDDFSGRTKLPTATFSLQSTRLTWDELVGLPADPKALRKLIDRDVAGLPQGQTYVVKIAAELLAETPAPPELRRALWQVIAGVPGVVSRGDVQDSLGRTGVALSYTAPDRGKQVYIIDPATGRILETRLDVGRTSGTKFRATYLKQGPADSTDE